MSDYQEYVASVKAKGAITIHGATAEEIGTIRAALNLYRTRNAEKHTENPNMGWGAAAKSAEEIDLRIP